MDKKVINVTVLQGKSASSMLLQYLSYIFT
jgi:hypothetical protein